MFANIEHFKNQWQAEMEATDKLMAALTDESLAQKVAPGHWTLGHLAWHITQTIPEMAARTGLEVEGPADTAPMPKQASEIRAIHLKAAQSLLERIVENWTDQTLEEKDDMYGEQWKRGKTMMVLMNHAIHHRGQMTILMRQAGLKVPGLYGPAKEEWGQFGMPIPEY